VRFQSAQIREIILCLRALFAPFIFVVHIVNVIDRAGMVIGFMKGNNCSLALLFVTAVISFAAGILSAVFLPNIVIIVLLTVFVVVLCILFFK